MADGKKKAGQNPCHYASLQKNHAGFLFMAEIFLAVPVFFQKIFLISGITLFLCRKRQIFFQRKKKICLHFRIVIQYCLIKTGYLDVRRLFIPSLPETPQKKHPAQAKQQRKQNPRVFLSFTHNVSSMRYPKLRTVFRQAGWPSFSRSRFMATVRVLSLT